MKFLGLDPGVLGGVAAIDETGIVLMTAKMPATVQDLLDLLQPYGSTLGAVTARAILEKVHSQPGQGHSGAFTFGRGVGRLETSLAASKIPYDEVAPTKWQAVMQCLTGGDKNVSKRRAQQLFPLWKIDHHVADALLLAEYGRRLELKVLP